MLSVFNFKTLLFLTVLIFFLMGSSVAFPQSIRFDLDLSDLKQWYRESEEYPILKELATSQDKTIKELERSLALAQKELELERKENEINKRIIAVKDMEIAGINRNFDQMKEVADRAIKLAETVKPKSNWQLLGLLGVIAFVAGLAVGL